MSQRNTGVSSPVRGPGADRSCEAACTVLQVLERIGGKWSIGVLLAAMDGPVRFTELERRVNGISRRMLTLTLRNLERDGLLVRTVYPTVPPKVEYAVTDMAKELYDSLQALTAWAERHLDHIAESRRRYDAAAR